MSYNYDPRNGFQNNNYQNNKKNDPDLGSWIIIGILLFTVWPVGLFLLIAKLKDDRTKRVIRDSRERFRYEVHQRQNQYQQTQYRQEQYYQDQSRQQRYQSEQARRDQYREELYRRAAERSAGENKKESDVKQKFKQVTKSPKATPKGAKAMQIAGWILVALGGMMLLSEFDEFMVLNLSFLFSIVYDLGFLGSGAALLAGSQSMKKRARRFTKYLACAGKRTAISIAEMAKAADVKEEKAEKDLEIMVENGMFGPTAYVDNGNDMLFLSQEDAEAYFKEKNRPIVPKQAEEGFSGIIRNMRRANDRISDPVLSEKIDRIEYVSAQILKEIERNPSKRSKATTFLNYYLPTTQKLLDSYADFEEAGIRGENSNKARAQIEETMDNILAGFEHQLDELFRDDAMDINADIKVMNSMLKRDTSSPFDDFGAFDGGTAVEEAPETFE